MNNTVHLIDCMDFMSDIPDKFYELAIVDPPYAVGAADGNFGRRKNKYRKDLHRYANASSVPDSEYFRNLFRVSVNQIIWGGNYYPKYLWHSGWIVWDKMKTDGLFSEAELAFQSFNKTVKIFRHQWEGFKKGRGSFEITANKTIHPNQKPLKLYSWLLKNYAKPGDKIFDSHVGSGSSRIACYDMGFDFTGYEIDEDYWQAQEDRFQNHIKQGSLFEFAGGVIK